MNYRHLDHHDKIEEKPINATACSLLKKQEDYFTRHTSLIKGPKNTFTTQTKREWVDILTRYENAIKTLFMAHMICGITLFLTIVIKSLNKNLFLLESAEIYTMPIYQSMF